MGVSLGSAATAAAFIVVAVVVYVEVLAQSALPRRTALLTRLPGGMSNVDGVDSSRDVDIDSMAVTPTGASAVDEGQQDATVETSGESMLLAGKQL